MIDANTNSSSIYDQKLDMTKVGALGHSQGATGAERKFGRPAIVNDFTPVRRKGA